MPELADPWLLVALPLPLLIAWAFGRREAPARALFVPEQIGAAMVAASGGPIARSSFRPRAGLLTAAWILLVAAASGPRDLAPVSALKVSGRDLALVLDLSGSMVRDDFFFDGRQITRLEAVTGIGSAFARRRGGDRMALIVFGS